MQINFCIYFMEKTILLETHDSHFILRISDIIRIETDEKSSEIFLKGGKMMEYQEGMDFWIAKLIEHPFIKIHDQHMVNLHAIDSYDLKEKPFVTMNNGERIQVQEKYKRILIDFWSQIADHGSRKTN